ncbi:MAG: hypothetical protein L0Y56_18905, partial [Nitrospira sp.]|nr:hypothetical protein [Nitrospira sp.]
DPEVQLSPGSQHEVPLPIIQTELSAPFDKSWQAALDTIKQSGHSISEAVLEEGKIRTLDKQFEGPNYPWRESYSIQMVATRGNHTQMRVRRTVKVYRRIFLVGPTIWMTRPSNGQREKMLIEHVTQRLGTRVKEDEN